MAPPETEPAGPPGGATLIAAARDEGPFLLEWIAYHRWIGFSDVVIATNDCEDGSPALLDRLQALGIVHHLPTRPGLEDKPQLVAYREAAQHPAVRAARWSMVLDLDEFLNIHAGAGRLTDLVAAVPDATAFLVNWRVFGSGERHAFEPGLVAEQFSRAAPLDNAANRSFKTLFTRFDAYECPLLPHGPGYAHAERLVELRPVDGDGRPLGEPYIGSRDFLQSEPGRVSWRLAQVNHYNTRSLQDHRVKHRRGGGITRQWDREWNFTAFDRNEEEDRSIQAKLGPVRAMVEAWLADGELRRLHEENVAAYGALARSLDAPSERTS